MVRTSGFGPDNLGSNPSSRVKIDDVVLYKVLLFELLYNLYIRPDLILLSNFLFRRHNGFA